MALKCDQEQQVDTNLTTLKKTIRECGVSFAIGQQQEGRKGTSGHLYQVETKKRLIKVKVGHSVHPETYMWYDITTDATKQNVKFLTRESSSKCCRFG